MMAFPANFSYWPFAAVMFVSGVGGGLFASPNTASIMNSVPARHRGAASGMRVTFAQVGMPLSMGLFFTLLVFGLNAKVPSAMYQGLVAHGVPAISATRLSHLPPLGYLFAAFLGLNPLKSLLGPAVLGHLAPGQAAALTSRAFFPQLIGPSFKHGLLIILAFAVVMSLIAALASALRGEKFIHEDDESRDQKAQLTVGAVAVPNGDGADRYAAVESLAGAAQQRSPNEQPGPVAFLSWPGAVDVQLAPGQAERLDASLNSAAKSKEVTRLARLERDGESWRVLVDEVSIGSLVDGPFRCADEVEMAVSPLTCDVTINRRPGRPLKVTAHVPHSA
jgi:hypothetical protein